MNGAQTVSLEFVAILVTIDRCLACGYSKPAAIVRAAIDHMTCTQTVSALLEARELRELERLALLADSENLGALLRRQGN